jgi:hypothetical protein
VVRSTFAVIPKLKGVFIMVLFVNGLELEGNILNIVDGMWSQHFHNDLFKNRIEFIDYVVRDTWRLLAIGLQVQGETEIEKCESFIEQLKINNLVH